jgi:DcuC family C4-dicarboxylate transporter
MLMFVIARRASLWFRIFVETMGKTDFLKVILPVFAFTSVAKETGCTGAFVNVFADSLASWGPLLVPVTVLAAFLTNMVLVSATASGLAVGLVFLPLLESAGIDSALAAAAILAGTWGAVLSPGSKHAVLIAQATNRAQSGAAASSVQAMDIVRGHVRLVVPMLAVVMAVIGVESWLFPNARVATNAQSDCKPPGGADWLRALVTVIPLVLLWLLPRVRTSMMTRWISKDFLVLQTMLLGTGMAVVVGGRHLLLSEGKPVGSALSDAFFSGEGMAYAYGNVMTIIISAMVFVAGLKRLGVLRGILALLRRQHRSAAWLGLFGSMGFAGLSGSGDAAACSFNLGVTPHARTFNARPRELGSMAWLGAEMGRCFSPVAAITLALGRAAQVQAGPMPIVAWTIVPIATAGLVGVLLRRLVRG